MNEEDFRSRLDAHGVLREGALDAPARERAFTVFAQRSDARVELAAWQRNAERFFGAKVGLTVDKRYPDGHFPARDAMRVVVAGGGADGARLCFGRPRLPDNLRAAEDADTRAGGTGLALLAKRCPSVWLVVTEGERDRVALRLAAILASVLLGPILGPDGAELFGIRTARLKLEG